MFFVFKIYDAKESLKALRHKGNTPHVATVHVMNFERIKNDFAVMTMERQEEKIVVNNAECRDTAVCVMRKVKTRKILTAICSLG